MRLGHRHPRRVQRAVSKTLASFSQSSHIGVVWRTDKESREGTRLMYRAVPPRSSHRSSRENSMQWRRRMRRMRLLLLLLQLVLLRCRHRFPPGPIGYRTGLRRRREWSTREGCGLPLGVNEDFLRASRPAARLTRRTRVWLWLAWRDFSFFGITAVLVERAGEHNRRIVEPFVLPSPVETPHLPFNLKDSADIPPRPKVLETSCKRNRISTTRHVTVIDRVGLTCRPEAPRETTDVSLGKVAKLLHESRLAVLLPFIQCDDKEDWQVGRSNHEHCGISHKFEPGSGLISQACIDSPFTLWNLLESAAATDTLQEEGKTLLTI